ncbi:glycosyl transferase [Actinoplanes sp. NBRC 14428]|uniref:Polysaccharide deacetylase n=1 Tax=Pseudosporangium ferrugineum TaxID=439699 RepID=A0A2T0SF58_9ACTN|nr:polysaccharide deacetylase family protein [Pseudosporangium ferrugineum]PRY32048.1 polysaccharide deacetylase [Pseudosporangium ferrugineum]BCJ49713.1 glycosyl transferase [Actinoplanes sp. NBRC 14428]
MSAHPTVNVCFHGVGTPGRELEPGEDHYWVSVERFHAVLDEVATWPSVRLSFDDGNASDVELALPALLERGLTAEFFLLAGRLDQPGSVSTEGVRELRRGGMQVGSHGMRHRSWRGLSEADSDEEFVAARQVLAEASGAPVTTAACPLGRYDRQVITRLRRHGYTRVYTSDRRPARPDAWLQPRYSVREHDDPAGLRAELLRRAPLSRRLRAAAVGTVKRWR